MEVLYTGDEVPRGTVLSVATMFGSLMNRGPTGMMLAMDLAVLAHGTAPGMKVRRDEVERIFPGAMANALVAEGLANYAWEIHDITLTALRALTTNAEERGFDLTDPYTGNVVRPYRI